MASSSLTLQDLSIPITNRYVMYAPKLKKVKPTRSTMALPKTNRSGVNQHQPKCGQQTGKIQTMFESNVCSGESSTCDAYEEAIKQNAMQVDGQDIDVNYCTLSESENEIENEIQIEDPAETEIATIGSVSDLLSFELEF